MTRRTLWICLSFAVLSQLSAGCYTMRPCFWRGGCYSSGLTPPGAGTSFSPGPLLPRPVLPLLPRPWLAPGYPVDGGPQCATCAASPVTFPVPPGGPEMMSGGLAPGGVIASTSQQMPTLNYGPLPAGFTGQPVYLGQPSTPLPQPKVYPSNDANAPKPMPTTGQK